MRYLLEVENVNAGYGKSQIIYDISFKVQEGSLSSLLGPNGSGKSTVLKTVVGLTTIYSGPIRFNGEEINGLKPFKIGRKGLIYLPQIESVYRHLTVRENFVMAGYTLTKEERNARIEEVLEVFPVLRHFMNRKAFSLSGGEAQMLALAMALIRKPILLMLDEPTANLSPKLSRELFKKIKEINDMGITILLVEQNVKSALEISDHAILLVSGRINYNGDAGELIKDPKLGKLFLGLESG